MSANRVHFEIFVRKIPGAPWSLYSAMDDRAEALEAAKLLMDERKVSAVQVSKETLQEDTGFFDSVVIQQLGSANVAAKSRPKPDAQALCVTPQDLYTVHARERIGELLEDWLARNRATPFELLHRPDLAETLEASHADLQHAIQKISIPEAHARNQSVHELMRGFKTLVERTIEKLLADAKRGVFPKFDLKGFAAAAERLSGDPERGYLLGGGIAAQLASQPSWSAKITRLLDLADAAPESGPARGFALHTLMQPLAEILQGKAGIDEVLGSAEDLGSRLAAMTRLSAPVMVDRLIQHEKSVARAMPELSPIARRLAEWLAKDAFQDVRAAMSRRVVRELRGPRRLKPGDAEGEIHVLRALGMSLTAAAGKLIPHEEVQAAFTARSKTLVTSDFVEAYLARDLTPAEEIQALIWLAENVIGAANKREASGWLRATVESLRFERDMLESMESPSVKLSQLAALQRTAGNCGLSTEDSGPIQAKLGDLGGELEARTKLTMAVARASAPPAQRLVLLLKLAVGETAPLGPAANRAKAEALKLIKLNETRAALAAAPDQMASVKTLLQKANLAA